MSLKVNTVWNLLGTGLPLLVGLFTIPFLITRIGVEAFGILTLVWALIGYFSLFDFGLGRALTQQVASRLAARQPDQIPALLTSGLLFTGLAGVAGGLLLAALAYPLGRSWLKVSAALQADTFACLLMAAVGIPMTTLTTGLRGVIEAYEHFKGINVLRAALGTANFALPALSVLLWGPSLMHMVLSLVAARAVVMLAHVLLMHGKLPAQWFKARAQAAEVRRLFSFGAWMTVSNVISPLMVMADRFVISAVLGAGVVAYYTVPSEFLSRVLILPAALTGALFPRLAALIKSDPEQSQRVYAQSLKVIILAMFPICLAIAAGSYTGLSWWLGAAFADRSWLIVCILALGIFFNGVAFVPYTMIQARGGARTTATIHMAEAVVYVPVLLLSLNYFGVEGAAVAWSARVGVDLLLMLAYA